MSDRPIAMGAVLAGGLGRRLGGAKATVALAGRPLITYPLRALQAALSEVVVVAKADSELPRLDGVPVWVEPDEPRHPLTGLVHALTMAAGRPVVVCACDLPLISPALLAELAHADPAGAPAVVAQSSGALHPLVGCYHPAALAPLRAALDHDPGALREILSGLEPRRYESEGSLFNVNTPEELRRAEELLAQPKVKS